MELNFSNKNDDEDELDLKGADKDATKQELDENVEDDRGESLKYDEEQKDFQMKKQLQTKHAAGRGKL